MNPGANRGNLSALGKRRPGGRSAKLQLVTPALVAARTIKPWKYDLDRIADYYIAAAEQQLRRQQGLRVR
jgi:hypothetical protein